MLRELVTPCWKYKLSKIGGGDKKYTFVSINHNLKKEEVRHEH